MPHVARSSRRRWVFIPCVAFLLLSHSRGVEAFQAPLSNAGRPVHGEVYRSRPLKPIDRKIPKTKLGLGNRERLDEGAIQILDNDDGHLDPTQEAEATRTKYIMLGLLWITAILAALDRVAVSVALVPMTAEFDYTDTAKGSISSLLSVGYGLFILPAGLIVGSISPRLVMISGIAVWSLATVGTPFAAGLLGMTPLLVARAMVGAGESIVLPTTQRLLSVWASPNEKSRAIAFIFSGFQVGTIAAYLLSPWIMDNFGGWRDLFYAYGTAGLVILIPWLALARDSPATIPEEGMERELLSENASLGEEISQVFREAPWLEMLRSKGVWAMTLAHASKNWGSYLVLAWTPIFYAEQYGIGVRDSAWLSVGPSVLGALGGAVAGTLCDSTVRDIDPNDIQAKNRIRKTFQAVGLLGPAVALGSLAANIPEQAWVAQLFLAAALSFQGFNSGGYDAANQEKAGPRWAGLLYSVSSLPAVLAGTGGVYATGRLLDASNQNWSLIFGLTAAINALGAIAFIVLYDSRKEFD